MNLLLQSLLLFCLLVSVGDCKYAINVHTCSFDSEELNLSCKMAKSGEYGPDRRLAGIVKLTLMVTSGRQTTLMDLELMPDLRQLEILGPCDAVTVKKADKVAKICQTGEMGTSPAQPKGTSEVNDGTQTPYSSSFEPLSTPLAGDDDDGDEGAYDLHGYIITVIVLSVIIIILVISLICIKRKCQRRRNVRTLEDVMSLPVFRKSD